MDGKGGPDLKPVDENSYGMACPVASCPEILSGDNEAIAKQALVDHIKDIHPRRNKKMKDPTQVAGEYQEDYI